MWFIFCSFLSPPVPGAASDSDTSTVDKEEDEEEEAEEEEEEEEEEERGGSFDSIEGREGRRESGSKS